MTPTPLAQNTSPPANAYTHAPRLHPNLLVGSFHLLFWLFFHPSAWRNYVARLDATLPPNFTLVELNRARLRVNMLRRLLLQGYLIFPLLVGVSVGVLLWAKGASFETLVVPAAYVFSINLTLALMISAVAGVPAGLVGGAAVGIAVGIVSTLTSGFVNSVAVPTAISLAIGAAMGVSSQMPQVEKPAYSSSRQIGGVVIGLAVGVLAVSAIRFGLTSLANLVFILPGDLGYNVARTIVVAASFGVAVGWQRSFRVGAVGAALAGLVYGLAVFAWKSGWSGLPIGLTSGMLFGSSFGATAALPYVLARWVAGPWAGAWAGALGSGGRHIFRNSIPLWPSLPLGLVGAALGILLAWWRPLLLYPFEAAWNLLLYRLDERRDSHHPGLLRRHAAFWDEVQWLPLPGLDDHLLLLMERNPAEGQAALEFLRTGRQHWAVQAAQIEMEARRLETCRTVEAIGGVHQHLAAGELAGPASPLLRSFSHMSQDVEAALNQATAYHQRLALGAIDGRLNSLMRELTTSSAPHAARFYPIAEQWHTAVANHLHQLAQAVEQGQEIDNPYVVGVPLTAQQEIFVGRTDIVARIEQLLLDRRHPPLLLYGQRRMGKTSLLRNLGRLLPKSIVPFFVDGQRVALAGDYADFLYNLAREMSKSGQQQRSLALPAISRQALSASPFTCFNEWLDDVEQALDAQDFNIALLALDEFEMVDNVLERGRFDETDVLSLLRHMIQHRPHFKVMLAGSHTLQEFRRWAGYLINVQVVKIGYLETEETRQLVERPVKNFTLQYEPAAGQRVEQLTRGHPALVQLLCYEIVTLKNEQESAGRRLARTADVEAAAARALDSGSFFFSDIQQNQVDESGSALLHFMATRGEGAVVSRAALRSHLSADNLDQTLQPLLQRDLIEAVDGGYRFQVELIRRWFEQSPKTPRSARIL